MSNLQYTMALREARKTPSKSSLMLGLSYCGTSECNTETTTTHRRLERPAAFLMTVMSGSGHY